MSANGKSEFKVKQKSLHNYIAEGGAIHAFSSAGARG
jgi:hypothetical protein